MPNLDFYAAGPDRIAVQDAVFELGLFRVFAARRRPGRAREFHARMEIGPTERHLALYAAGSGPEPAVQRHRCEGWGLIQLHFGDLSADPVLRWSHTNHNTEKRAMKWAGAVPELGDPALWNWATVATASGRLNRVIRKMGVRKLSSHPVLPHAAKVIDQLGLQYEYGVGIHATPSYALAGAGAHPRCPVTQ